MLFSITTIFIFFCSIIFKLIHHDIFSNWFIMRELIIKSIWIIEMNNSPSFFMSCFLGLVVEQQTTNYNFTDLRTESLKLSLKLCQSLVQKLRILTIHQYLFKEALWVSIDQRLANLHWVCRVITKTVLTKYFKSVSL